MTNQEVGVVHRIAAQWCRERGIENEADVEDIQQDTVLGVLERLRSVENHTEAFLVQTAQWILAKIGRDHGRAQGNEPDIMYLDESVDSEDEDGATQHDMTPDEFGIPGPEEVLTLYVQRQILDNFLGGLLPVEEQVLRALYGLDDDEAVTQAELAERLGMAQPNISRIHNRALQKLRGRNIAEVLGLV